MVLVFIFFALGCSGKSSPDWDLATPEETDRRLASAAREHNVDSFVAVVFRSGAMETYSGPGNRVPPDEVYELASLTKTLLAMAILAEERQGRLACGEIAALAGPGPATVPAAIESPPTALELLLHRSGVFEIRSSEQLDPPRYIQLFPPDATREYCNWNYAQLARWAVARSGEPGLDAFLWRALDLPPSALTISRQSSVPEGAAGARMAAPDLAGVLQRLLTPEGEHLFEQVRATGKPASLRVSNDPENPSDHTAYPVLFQTGKDVDSVAFLLVCEPLGWGCLLLGRGAFDSAFVEKAMGHLLQTRFPRARLVREAEPVYPDHQIEGSYVRWGGRERVGIGLDQTSGVLNLRTGGAGSTIPLERLSGNRFRVGPEGATGPAAPILSPYDPSLVRVVGDRPAQ
ncbi:MAG: serine hydrolase, partial [Sumerlaeia bacterium]